MNDDVTPLESAFSAVRANGDVDLALPALLTAQLNVVARSFPDIEGPQPVYSMGPDGEELCLTAAENVSNLAEIPDLEVISTTGEALLRTIGPRYGLILVSAGGGEYLPAEQLEWYRQQID